MSNLSAGEVAQIAAERAASVPGVARLDAGPLGTKATYGTSGRTPGVTVRTSANPVQVTVHIAVLIGERIPELAERVDAEVSGALAEAFPEHQWSVALDVVDVVLADNESTAMAAPARQELQ